jgi:hypothetical protein
MTTPNPRPAAPAVRSLNCPNCGGVVELRGMGRTNSAVCIQCLTVLDVSTPNIRILQKFESKQRFLPLIPLGTRGKMHGDPYEVIGFQVRQLVVDGIAYAWAEYLLFNPYKGFRYITEYNGHWNDVLVLQSIPHEGSAGGRKTVTHLGETYRHFQSYEATTTFVMGEFPWAVRVGETSRCADFVHPPRIISMEITGNETTWSLGEYMTGAQVWQHFQLKGSPPPAVGVFANQPSPHSGTIGKAWQRYLFWTMLLIALQLFWVVFHSNKTVFEQTFSYTQQATPGGENSFVTEVFQVPGRTSNLRVELRTNLNNNWAFFQLTLLNADTAVAYDFSRQVSYYHGIDSDGGWTEGRAQDAVVLPSIPPGNYYMRIEPEMDTAAARIRPNSVVYRVNVIRDVTTWLFFFLGMLLLLVPPIWTTIRTVSFETQRWAESDYGGGSSSSDD